MTKKNDHLKDYLARLLQDEERGRKSRLHKCPDEADELRPFIKTASDLARYGKSIKPRPEFAARIEAKLEKASALKYGSRQTAFAQALKTAGHWAISGAIAIAMLAFTLTGGFTLAATISKNTTPGQALYPIKVTAEKLKSIVFPEASQTAPIRLEETGAGTAGTNLEPATTDLDDRTVMTEESSYQLPEPESPDAIQDGVSIPDKADLVPEQPFSPNVSPDIGRNDNPGKADLAPGQQSLAHSNSDTDEKDNPRTYGNDESAKTDADKNSASSKADTDRRDNSDKTGLAPEQTSAHSNPHADGNDHSNRHHRDSAD